MRAHTGPSIPAEGALSKLLKVMLKPGGMGHLIRHGTQISFLRTGLMEAAPLGGCSCG